MRRGEDLIQTTRHSERARPTALWVTVPRSVADCKFNSGLLLRTLLLDAFGTYKIDFDAPLGPTE
jgi:hypothetical protein